MSIFGSSISQVSTQTKIPQKSTQALASSKEDVEQTFLDYMKKSPGQRMVDAWLKAHNLTEDDLKTMAPEKREAIMKQMAEDIKNEVKRKTDEKFSMMVNLT